MSLNVLILPKEDAVDAARVAATRVRVPTNALVLHHFCDASFKKGSPIRGANPQAAVAVVGNIWLPKATTCRRTTRGCFIPSNDPQDNNVTVEAFAVAEGVHLAIEQIKEMEESSVIGPTDKIEIVFWSDCMAVLKDLRHGVRASWHPKRFQHIVDIIEVKTRELQRSRENVTVHFVWCPGECVEPHRTADELSKQIRVTGGGPKSMALRTFLRTPHGNIQSALEQLHTDASQIEADQNTNTPIAAIAGGDEKFLSAVRQLTAAKLEEMAKELRAQDQAQNQAQDSEGQGHNSTDQEYKLKDQSVDHLGEKRQQDGVHDEEKEQFHDAKETADVEDEDKFYDAQEPAEGGDGNVELAMAGERVGRPSRARALWNWMRGRTRL